jgi:antitoxin component YwqK of YwqJK toxin-antitoxin module
MKTNSKIYLSVLVLFATSQFCLAQDQKTTTLSDQTKVVYAMNDSKKLDGVYSVVKDDNKVFLRGIYKDNARAGNWYAFNNSGNVFFAL